MRSNIANIFITILLLSESCFAQSDNANSILQDSLSKLSSLIWVQKTDAERLKASDVFFNEFQNVLLSKTSSEIPLDSIRGITRVQSEDMKLRIFTWNVPLSAGTNKYFGFIQLMGDSSVVIPLQSSINQLAGFTTGQISPQTWYGALYYKLIQVDLGTKKAYTLLGWDGYTKDANRKLIDILRIDANGQIYFGMPVFKTAQGIQSRVVMEYAENANMLLRYDYQAIKVEKRKKIKKESAWLIVMDRLIPMDPTLKGISKYYVPAGDIYDGFIFRNGYWVLVEDIDVVNKVKTIK
jgi:hypothetical protein